MDAIIERLEAKKTRLRYQIFVSSLVAFIISRNVGSTLDFPFVEGEHEIKQSEILIGILIFYIFSAASFSLVFKISKQTVVDAQKEVTDAFNKISATIDNHSSKVDDSVKDLLSDLNNNVNLLQNRFDKIGDQNGEFVRIIENIESNLNIALLAKEAPKSLVERPQDYNHYLKKIDEAEKNVLGYYDQARGYLGGLLPLNLEQYENNVLELKGLAQREAENVRGEILNEMPDIADKIKSILSEYRKHNRISWALSDVLEFWVPIIGSAMLMIVSFYLFQRNRVIELISQPVCVTWSY